MCDWKKETMKKESRKIEFDKFKDRSLKSIIEKRKKLKNKEDDSESHNINSLCTKKKF